MDDGRRKTNDEGRTSCGGLRSSIVRRLSSFVRRPEPLTIPDELFDAFQAIAAQEGLTPGELLARRLRQAQKQRQAGDSLPGRWQTLSPRQQQVIFLACQGLSSREIAARMGISQTTIISHHRRAMKKLNLTRSQLKQALDQFDLTACHKDEG